MPSLLNLLFVILFFLSLCEPSASTESKEALPSRTTAAPFIQHYHEVYTDMMEGKRPLRFILYKNGDTTGWGNKLRAIYSSLLLALATDRILLLDYPSFFDHFLAPDGLKMNFKQDFPSLKPPSQDIRIGGKGRNGRDRLFLQSANLEVEYANLTGILYSLGYGFDNELMANEFCNAKLHNLLGLQNYSQMAGTAIVMPWLLQRMSQWFRQGINDTLSHLKIPLFGTRTSNDQLICCRLRIMDGRNRYRPFAQCFGSLMRNLIDKDRQSKIFFTTDRPHLLAKFKEDFEGKYEGIPIIFNPRQEERETNQVGDDYLPENSTLPHPAMVDWYLLGECDYLIGSRTTFSLFATARTGNSPSQKVFTTPPMFPCREMRATDYTF